MLKTAALKRSLPALGVDGILITDLANVRYLSGFSGSSAFIILTEKHSLFITDFRYKEQAAKEVRGFKRIIEHSERAEKIKALCYEFGVGILGIEADDLKYSFYKKLQKNKLKLKPLSNTIESLRIIKSAQELSKIRMAVKRAERAFRRLLPYIKLRETERGLAMRLEGYLKDEGCVKLPFSAIVASGPMSALPHARPTGRKLKPGDLVVFDWGGEYEGYFSDISRTVLLNGKNINNQKFVYSVVLEAQKRAIKAVGPGIMASAIDSAARDYMKDEDLDDFFGHATGHGVGLAIHEKPVVSWRSKDAVENGMVFTVEPGIYIPDFGGVRIEDMVSVTKTGVEVLTGLPKKLRII